MDLNTIHTSKNVRMIVIGLGVVVFTLAVFSLGASFGYHRAHFEGEYGNYYHREFVDPDGGRFGGMGIMEGGRPGPTAHGTVGRVVSVAMPKIIVAGPDNLERTVIIGANTLIRQYQNETAAHDIAVGDYIVVLGTPNNNGEIDANLIRIVPPPPGARTPAKNDASPATSTATGTAVQ